MEDWKRPVVKLVQAVMLDFVEVEVDTLAQFDIVLALETGLVDIVLLDNMRDQDMREAVARRDLAGSSIQLEASGGIDLDDACRVAGTGWNALQLDQLHGLHRFSTSVSIFR